MNKMLRGDYGPVPKSAPKKVPTSAKGVQVKGPSISHSYPASPKPPRQTYSTSMSSSKGESKALAGPEAGNVKYKSKVSKG